MKILETYLATVVFRYMAQKIIGRKNLKAYSQQRITETISCHSFDDIIKFLQLSADRNPDTQLLEFVGAVNPIFKDALRPGAFLT